MLFKKKLSVFIVSTLSSLAYANYNENHSIFLESAYGEISQIYEQQNLTLSSTVCTFSECTSNIVSESEIIGYVSTSVAINPINNVIKFNYKEYDYKNQKYSDSFLIILEDGENKFYTDASLADYAFNNGVLSPVRSKRGLTVRCSIRYDSDRGSKGNYKGGSRRGGRK